MAPLQDRRHAGQILAAKLREFDHAADTIVMALPRGGVPVAFEIAQALNLPLDVCVVRKLGVPVNPELAMGAVASGGVLVINHEITDDYGVPQSAIAREIAFEREEVENREREYRGHQPQLDLTGKTVIVVDDGIATGSTMDAAIRALRLRKAGRVIVAVGVAPRSTVSRLSQSADVITAANPVALSSVGEWFEDFRQVQGAEVRALLEQANAAFRQTGEPAGSGSSMLPMTRSTAASPGHS